MNISIKTRLKLIDKQKCKINEYKVETHTLEMEKNKCTSTLWQGRHSQQQFPLVDNTLGLWRIVRGGNDRWEGMGKLKRESNGRNKEVMG